MLDLADFALQEEPEENLIIVFTRAWYNGSYTMAAEPIKSLELHYTMIQFLIKEIMSCVLFIKTVNGLNPGVMSYRYVNYDHSGECCPEKDSGCSGCRNVSQCHPKQSFSGLHSPRRSEFTYLCTIDCSLHEQKTSVSSRGTCKMSRKPWKQPDNQAKMRNTSLIYFLQKRYELQFICCSASFILTTETIML